MIAHLWVWDHGEEMFVCADCDTPKGSRASLKPCTEGAPNE